MIMFIDRLPLYTIVLSFMLINYIQARSPSERITRDQFKGQWYEIGIIPNSEEIIAQSCIMYEIVTDGLRPDVFALFRVPIDAILGCGFPIYASVRFGLFSHSGINVTQEGVEPPMMASINGYNNQTELILTETMTESDGAASYRLWSRNRQVSAATKAEFEKLAGNRTATLYSWDHCPKLQSETDNKLTLRQIDGVWFEIAKVNNGKVDHDICPTIEIKANYENQTFTYTEKNTISVKATRRGHMVGSEINFEIAYGYDGYKTFIPVSFNNGADLVLREGRESYFVLLSRNPKVSTEMMEEFERFSKNFKDATYVVFPQDNCGDKKN